MKNLPRFALARRSLVIAIFILALVWSITSGLTMQRREDPLTTQRQTEIVTLWPGAKVETIEQLVTKKIVDDVHGVAGVDHVEGTSRSGISVVEVIFSDSATNADPILRDIRNHLSDLAGDLPNGLHPELIDDVWSTYPMIIGIHAKGYSAREIRDVAKHLADGLAGLPDVAKVSLVGEQRQQITIDTDLHALSQYGISANDMIDALQARNAIVPNGTLPLSGRLIDVDADANVHGLADIANTLVRGANGRSVRIADIAHVRAAYPDPLPEIVHVDGESGIALAIRMKEQSSVSDLGPSVARYLAKATLNWPAGVYYRLLANQPQTVHERMADFVQNLVFAVIVVTILVALFMGVRNGILVGLTVVISIVLTFGAMPFFGVDINQISILALIISLGIIVDAGIVSIDNIEHHLRAGKSRYEASWLGIGELWFPLLTSTLVAMSSFLPFCLMSGSIGDFVRALGVVTSISLFLSLVVAYFITPIIAERFAISSTLASGQSIFSYVPRFFDAALNRMRGVYAPVARFALHHARATVALAMIGIVMAIAWAPRLGVQFFPAADRNQFFIEVNAPEGTEIRQTERIVAHIESLLKHEPGITTWGAFIGRGAPRFYYNVLSEQPKPSYAQILVQTSDVDAANALIGKLQDDISNQVAGARIAVKKLEQGPPVGAPLQLRLTAQTREHLRNSANQIKDLLRTIPGVVNIRDSEGSPSSAFIAHFDERTMAAAGVHDVAIADALSLAYGGRSITDIREADRQTPIVIQLAQKNAASLPALGVRNSTGQTIPLGEFTTFEPGTLVSALTYRDYTPEIVVSADVAGVLASDALEHFKAALPTLRLPSDIHIGYAGEDEQTTKAFTSLFIALFVGLMINQILLIWEFRRLRLSLIILSAVPLGLIGAVFGLAITGNHFGFVAFLGIASLGGIVTNHTIVLFEYASREIQAGVAMEDALIIAGTKRLRPILLTISASIAGLLPLAFSAQTLWRPMCWVIIYGLLFSMLMTLIAIPALYRLFGETELEPA